MASSKMNTLLIYFLYLMVVYNSLYYIFYFFGFTKAVVFMRVYMIYYIFLFITLFFALLFNTYIGMDTYGKDCDLIHNVPTTISSDTSSSLPVIPAPVPTIVPTITSDQGVITTTTEL
jgi:hypothetical protein